MRHDNVLLGIGLMLGFCVTAPLIDVASKLAAATLSVGLITTARFVVQGAVMLPVCLALGHGVRIGAPVVGQLTLRALFLVLSTYFFVAAIAHMPIADALAIVFVEPFILLIFGALVLGDPVGPRRIGASVVGFLGALLVIQPSFTEFGAVALYPLGTALFFALYILVTRSLARHIHPVPMQYHTSLIAAAICLPLLVAGNHWQVPSLGLDWPQGAAWLWLIGVGLASAGAHMLMSYALRHAPATTLAPLHYLEIISAVFFGFAVFGDFPDVLTWVGIGVISLSGIYVILRERQVARQPRLAAAPFPPEL